MNCLIIKHVIVDLILLLIGYQVIIEPIIVNWWKYWYLLTQISINYDMFTNQTKLVNWLRYLLN